MNARWLLMLLAACDPGPAFGTSVGNPGKESFRVAQPADGLVLESASAVLSAQYLLACDGSLVEVSAGEDTDLVDGRQQTFPAGEWCALVLDLESIEVGLSLAEETRVEVSLRPATPWTWWMIEPLVVDETSYVIELGAPGWLEAEGLPEAQEGVVFVSDESPHAAQLIGALAEGGLFEDPDDDGELSRGEREIGSLTSPDPAQVPPPEDDEAERVRVEGCQNCNTAGRGPSGALLLALALAVTARRRTAA
jgi:hypothetical protein